MNKTLPASLSASVLWSFPAVALSPEVFEHWTLTLAVAAALAEDITVFTTCPASLPGVTAVWEEEQRQDSPGEGFFFYQSSVLEFEELAHLPDCSQRPGSKREAVQITRACPLHLHRSTWLRKGQKSKAFQKLWPPCACIIPPGCTHRNLGLIWQC